MSTPQSALIPPLPVSWRCRARTSGYLLIEALSALAVVGLGLLPLATLGPTGLHWLGEQQAIAHATRIAAEAAELAPLDDSVSPLSMGQATARQLLRFCGTAPADADAGACGPGNRLAVVSPLTPAAGALPSRSLRMVALWIRP
jgi:hypothetical protein